MRAHFMLGAAIATLVLAQPAAALTYFGSQGFNGDDSLSFAIETDGTLGLLAEGNILSWAVVTDFAGTVTAGSGSDPGRLILTGGLSATAQALFFDFDGGELFAVFADDDATALCLDGAASSTSCIGDPRGVLAGLALETGELRFAELRGTRVVASVSGIIPEPAAWGLMITGFGLVGHALRRRDASLSAAKLSRPG